MNALSALNFSLNLLCALVIPGIAAAQSGNPGARPQQGYFHFGGKYVNTAVGTMMERQKYVEYRFPAKITRRYPVVMANRLGADIIAVLKKPDTRDRLQKLGAQPTVESGPDAFDKYVRREYESFRKLIPEIRLKPQ